MFLINVSEGALDIFDDHDILTQCDQFDMKNSAANQIIMYLVHEGKCCSGYLQKAFCLNIMSNELV